jgi:hypothetical protein
MVKPSGNNFQDFCTLYGSVSISWTWAENALALSIGIIDQNVVQLRDNKELPVSTKRRLKYLRAALVDVIALKPVQQLGDALAHKFPLLAKRRNKLIHGSLWELPEGGFELVRLETVGRVLTRHSERLEKADLVLLNAEVSKLADEAGAFLLGVAAIYP